MPTMSFHSPAIKEKRGCKLTKMRGREERKNGKTSVSIIFISLVVFYLIC